MPRLAPVTIATRPASSLMDYPPEQSAIEETIRLKPGGVSDSMVKDIPSASLFPSTRLLMYLRTLLLGGLLVSSIPAVEPGRVGLAVDGFSLKDSGGKVVSLSDYKD